MLALIQQHYKLNLNQLLCRLKLQTETSTDASVLFTDNHNEPTVLSIETYTDSTVLQTETNTELTILYTTTLGRSKAL